MEGRLRYSIVNAVILPTGVRQRLRATGMVSGTGRDDVKGRDQKPQLVAQPAMVVPMEMGGERDRRSAPFLAQPNARPYWAGSFFCRVKSDDLLYTQLFGGDSPCQRFKMQLETSWCLDNTHLDIESCIQPSSVQNDAERTFEMTLNPKECTPPSADTASALRAGLR